jgi:hypothetical protein
MLPMTGRAFSVVLLPTSLFVLLCVLAIRIGAARPDPDLSYWRDFGFTACALPCYAGMTPGVTDFRNTVELIAANVPVLSRELLVSTSQTVFFGQDDATFQTLSGLARYANGMVGEIRLTLFRTLSSVILRFGPPDCTLIYPPTRPTVIFLYWQGDTALVWASASIDQAVLLRSPVFTIATTVLENRRVCESSSEIQPWRGFAAVWRYLRDYEDLYGDPSIF